MGTQKYNPRRTEFLFAGWLTFIATIIQFVVVFLKPVLHATWVYTYLLVILAYTIINFICAKFQKSYYTVSTDGICVYRYPDTIIANIPWARVYGCSVMTVSRRTLFPDYFVLVLDRTAMLHGNFALGWSGRIPERYAKKYWFHRAAEQLARKQINATVRKVTVRLWVVIQAA